MVLDAAEKYGYDFSKIYEKQMAKTGTIYFIIYKKTALSSRIRRSLNRCQMGFQRNARSRIIN